MFSHLENYLPASWTAAIAFGISPACIYENIQFSSIKLNMLLSETSAILFEFEFQTRVWLLAEYHLIQAAYCIISSAMLQNTRDKAVSPQKECFCTPWQTEGDSESYLITGPHLNSVKKKQLVFSFEGHLNVSPYCTSHCFFIFILLIYEYSIIVIC